jgi:hypothetical protein
MYVKKSNKQADAQPLPLKTEQKQATQHEM